MALKRRNKAPQKEKKGTPHEEKKIHERGKKAPQIEFFSGGGANAQPCHPPPGTPMSENDYKMHNIFGNYLSHNYNVSKYSSRLHPIELFQ